MLKEEIHSLIAGKLGRNESLACLGALSTGSSGQLNDEIFAATIESVRATALENSNRIFDDQNELIDCCGTGGSGLSHYNTSTTVAFILAAAGLKVAKFGNRSASGQTGSFDLLDRLGIGATLPVERLPELLAKTNLVFLFAPQFYPALARLASLRRDVGHPTVFNYIGPLLNPARPALRFIGVPNRQAQGLVAGYLQGEGLVKSAMVINAASGLDELDVESENTIATISCNGTTAINGDAQKALCQLETVDFNCLMPAAKLTGRKENKLTVDESLAIFEDLINNRLDDHNYYHALVCFNAAGSLRAARLTSSWEEGMKLAADLIKSGAVKEKLNQYQKQYQ